MAGLQRSAVSFRRQGSSGLVWDDKLISGELNKVNQKQEHEEQEPQHDQKTDIKLENDVRPTSRSSTTPSITIERSRSNGGQRGYRTGRVSPAIEPPSPKLSENQQRIVGKKPVWADPDSFRYFDGIFRWK
ncbi:hypothetical protein NC653_008445 [Populus alba x Populus x berolinensis]|uniref:MAPK kinase substrate protein n=1 Tax=Populus alba x Populus x berolinensis TaxID=444605 RepID=A0AAD6W8I9_9ROSI|nr:hypothetical protein NC653_008445 [Populus alba x Populus x berolinensis]